MDAEQTLHSVPIFRSLQSKHLRSLTKGITSRTFQPGQIIVEQGQSGYGLYVIESGRVRVTQEAGGASRELNVMGPGESFGELSLIDDQPRSATVTAVEPTTTLILDKWQFHGALDQHPEIAVAMLPTLVQWVRGAQAVR